MSGPVLTRFAPGPSLRGTLRIPSDKSITQRALIIGALCDGPVTVHEPLWAGDTQATADMLRQLGVTITRADDVTTVCGHGLRGLRASAEVLDARNSGTGMRLVAAICAGQSGRFEFDGDESLRSRPMDRVVDPLRAMGVDVTARQGRFAPLVVRGGTVRPISYRLPIASAQVKSAVLLAGLFADGVTEVIESIPSRDHTERMLRSAGVPLNVAGTTISVPGVESVHLEEISVPGDISSAAFLVAAAALVPDSDLRIENVGLNPTRLGFLEVLKLMGGGVTWETESESGNEPRGTIHVVHQPLHGVAVIPDDVPSLIDEVALVALLACHADGPTSVEGVAELRVKESDRLAAIGEILTALGGDVDIGDDSFVVRPRRLRGGTVHSRGDHRLALLGAIAGLVADEGVGVEDFAASRVTFPDFERALREAVS